MTWKVRGKVYLYISRTDKPEYMNLFQNALEESYNSIKKSMELDLKNNILADNKQVLIEISIAYFNQAGSFYNTALLLHDSATFRKDSIQLVKAKLSYANALKQFDIFWEILDKLGYEKYSIIDFLERNKIKLSDIYIESGYSAKILEDWDKAKKYYSKVIDLKGDPNDAREVGDPLAYMQYADVLASAGYFDESIDVIERAKELWPENKDIVIIELKIYQDANKLDELAKRLEDALIADPYNINLNAIYAGTLGSISDTYSKMVTTEKINKNPDQKKISEFEAKAGEYILKAIAAYNKAIDITNKHKNELKYVVKGVSPTFEITYKNESGELKSEKVVSGWEYSLNVTVGFQSVLKVKGFDKKSNSIAEIYLGGSKVKESKASGKSEAKAEYIVNLDDFKKNDNLYDLYYNCGILYFNPGVDAYNDAANSSDEKIIKEYEKKYLDLFEKALPYIEKAYQIDPNAKEAKIVLKNIYLRNGNTEKAKDLDK